MERVENRFLKGIKDGIPIALGYLSVSFTFGMMAVSLGVPLEVAVVVSLTNLTSAGQFAGLPIMILPNAYIEMALTQLVINMRYALMSLSLSQKIEGTLNTLDRAIMAFGITDEIFAVAMNQEKKVGKHYFLGLMITPIIGWTLGTFIGGGASQLLPVGLRDALNIAIYGMFLAIIIPPAKKLKGVRICIILSALLSCLFTLLESVIVIGSGFVIIICTLIAASLMAYISPIREVSHE